MSVKTINSKDEFDALVESGKVILIDFYADWCGPCKMISPVFEKLAKEQENSEDVEFYKVNIDNVPDVAEALSISSIPTFHAYKSGKRLDKVVGANSAALTTFVNKAVPGAQ